MTQQTVTHHSCAVRRHLNHMAWLLDEWPWHAFLATAVFVALATLFG